MSKKQYGYTYIVKTKDNQIKNDIVAATRESKARQILKTQFLGCEIVSLERNSFAYQIQHYNREI